MADTDKLVKVGQLDSVADAVIEVISDTNERLGDLSDGYTSLTADKFAQATLNNDGSLDYTKKYDASTVETFSFTYPVRIVVKDGYKMRILRQNQDESFSDSGFITWSYYVVTGQNIKLQIRKDPLSTSVNADLNTFAQQVLFILKDKEQLIRNTAQIDYLRSGYELIDTSFQRGGMVHGAVQPTVRYRVYTPNMLNYDRDITIVSKDGFRFGLHYFDENGVFTTETGWKTSYAVPAGQNFKMVIARTTEDTSESADVYYFSEQFYIQTPLRDYIDEATGNSATNGAINNAMFGAGRAKLVSHMGYHVGIPENSTASYIAAGKRGYWGIESDVQQTSDGYYVMCHDNTVDRTTDGSGSIANMTLAEIRALHLTGDSSLTVPTFEEYLGICKQYGCVPMIELKGTVTNTAESYTKIIGIVKDMGFTPDSILFSGSKYALSYFRQADEDFIYAPIYQSGGNYSWDTEFNFCKGYKKTMMNWDILLGLTSERIKQAHGAGIPICAFITNTVEATQTAFIAGADCCTTNVVTPTD